MSNLKSAKNGRSNRVHVKSTCIESFFGTFIGTNIYLTIISSWASWYVNFIASKLPDDF